MPDPTPPPGIKVMINNYFELNFHLEGLWSPEARAQTFLHAWGERERQEIAAIPDHSTWRLP